MNLHKEDNLTEHPNQQRVVPCNLISGISVSCVNKPLFESNDFRDSQDLSKKEIKDCVFFKDSRNKLDKKEDGFLKQLIQPQKQRSNKGFRIGLRRDWISSILHGFIYQETKINRSIYRSSLRSLPLNKRGNYIATNNANKKTPTTKASNNKTANASIRTASSSKAKTPTNSRMSTSHSGKANSLYSYEERKSSLKTYRKHFKLLLGEEDYPHRN